MLLHKKIILYWRRDLALALSFYENRRSVGDNFFLYLFSFFIFLNIKFYWFAISSAFHHLVFGNHSVTILSTISVGILGALFDSLSFFVTIYIVKRALSSVNTKIYIAHLSIDLVIAVLATFWVVFVFIVSGWAVSFIDTIGQSKELIQTYDHETNINKRTDKYVSSVMMQLEILQKISKISILV